MAKGPLFLSTFSGKVGNIVGYKLTNSNNKEVQGTRAYQPLVSNPRTEPQAIQRLKMAPALNFYRSLSLILDNAWQGQKYGVKSRQFFMSLAMKQSTGIPFVTKGDKRFFPGEYQVSQGSLVRVAVDSIATDLLTTSLVSGGVTGTWGEVSQGIINKNFGIKNGDKLTFIFVGTSALGDYVPAFSYVILDTTSTEQASTILAGSNLSFAGAVDSPLTVGISNAVSGIVAGAAIVSRLDLVSGTDWQRSDSVMFCTADYKEQMMSSAMYEIAIMSYMDSQSYMSDWYLNAGIMGNYTPSGQGGSSSNVTVVSRSNIFAQIGGTSSPVAIATMSDGTKRAYCSNTERRYVCYLSGGSLVYSSNLYVISDTYLSNIQSVDSGVIGWIVADASISDGGNYDVPPE